MKNKDEKPLLTHEELLSNGYLPIIEFVPSDEKKEYQQYLDYLEECSKKDNIKG